MDSSTYRQHPIEEASLTEVSPDNRRRFLVVSGTPSRTGEPWTLVLEFQDDYWISRRELTGAFAPEAAVSGYLFNREGYQDPIVMLRRMNELVRVEYYQILQAKMKGDRERNELVSEVTRLRARIDELKRESRRKIPRREGSARRPSSSRSTRGRRSS